MIPQPLDLIRQEIAAREYQWGLGLIRAIEVRQRAQAEYEAGLRRQYPAMRGAR